MVRDDINNRNGIIKNRNEQISIKSISVDLRKKGPYHFGSTHTFVTSSNCGVRLCVDCRVLGKKWWQNSLNFSILKTRSFIATWHLTQQHRRRRLYAL